MSLFRLSRTAALLALLALATACDNAPDPPGDDSKTETIDSTRAQQRYQAAREDLRDHLLSSGGRVCTPAYRGESLRERADAIQKRIARQGARVNPDLFRDATAYKADVQTVRTIAEQGPDAWIARAGRLRRELGRTVHALDDAFARAREQFPDRRADIERRRQHMLELFRETNPAWRRIRATRDAAAPRDCLQLGHDVALIRARTEAAHRALDLNREFLNTLE